MIKKQTLEKLINPILEQADSFVLSFHLKEGGIQQVICGAPDEMDVLIASLITRVEETTGAPATLQLDYIKVLLQEAKQKGMKGEELHDIKS